MDVIVCDGFIGNIALKISEGLVEHIGAMLKKAIKSSLKSQVGYVLSKDAFDSFRKRTDSSEYGGAPLLGVRGITIIGHGRSNRQRHQERHSRRHRALPLALQRKNRTGAFRCRRLLRAADLRGIAQTLMSKLAFLFPGQASQYPGMGRDLAENFPESKAVFDEADAALGFSICQNFALKALKKR